jgi:hypothetical protein
MPQGKGTYGSKRGRPPKKRKYKKKASANGSAARTRRPIKGKKLRR